MTSSLETLRQNLKQKWRNVLNKSEKQGLEIEENNSSIYISWILKRYIDDRIQKKYPGPGPKFLGNLMTFCAQSDDLHILRALKNGKPIAGLCVIKHGTSATYQIGWANDEGRKFGAMNFLLWEAIKILKDEGITGFDLGGINEQAEGLTKFKEGLGGEKITYLGHFFLA